MLNILFFFICYFLILISIIGYGFLIVSKEKKYFSIGFLGLKGLFVLIIFSYFSNFITPHNLIHNSIILIIGILLFIYNYKNKINIKKKNNSFIILSIIVLFLGILVEKNHDDFFYYHFGYTLSLVNFSKIIGIGHLEHGFRTPSSIFYLNSLFYLPKIKYFMMHTGAIYFMAFSNIYLIEKIFYKEKLNKNLFIIFLSLFSLIFVNTVFTRVSEHGTDRSALILILLLSIIFLENINSKLKDFKFFKKNYEEILIILFLIISLKSFYLIYLIFLLFFLYKNKYVIQNFLNIKKILTNKITLLFSFGILLIFLTSLLNTGCLIYPASFTCFESLSWTINKEDVSNMKSWYELWSKAGANPNYRVENPLIYIQNFNWVSNWFSNYFFNKVSDFILVLLLISIVMILVFYGKKKRKVKINISLFLSLIIVLFIEWFFNHPSLRYGGYTIIALLNFVPLSFYLSKNSILNNLDKKLTILVFLSLAIFSTKNILRLIDENLKYNYNPIIHPFYSLNHNSFIYDKKIKELQHINNYQNKKMLIINEELLKSFDTKK
tara:strand:+ start:4751 stop:6403 length:1653 start_codon:yes stop_codon:yes gene_type:complete